MKKPITTKADELPPTSEISSVRMMRHAQNLMRELSEVRAQLGPLEARKREITEELEKIRVNEDLEGFRFDDYAFYAGSSTRSTLDPELLLKAGVKAAIIEKCTKETPVQIRYFKIHTKQGWE